MGSTPIAETILKKDCTEKSTTQKGENMKKIERDDELSIIKYLHTATFDSVCASADFDATVALKYGLVFVDDNGNVLRKLSKPFVEAVIQKLGLNNEIWSNTFHKSWNKVENAPIEQLVFEQLVHYFSTYGMEFLGLEAMPLIPCETVISNKDVLPSIKAFTVIRVVDYNTAIAVVKNLLKTVKAPHKNDIVAYIDLMEYTDLKVDEIVSFELKIARCKQLNTVPVNGQDFIRYAIYEMTGSTLVIKNEKVITKIKDYCLRYPNKAYNLLSKCDEIELAKVFYRFKPLILAFKESDRCKPIVNKIRRLATTHHEPLSDVNIANLANLVIENRLNDVYKLLKKADNRTLVKLINFAVSTNSDVKIYNIRNGKTFVTERESDNRSATIILTTCLGELMNKNANKLVGKTFLIPDYVEYPVPISEKQMIGNLPYGPVINGTKGDTITPAIWWANVNGRVDIDLHLISANEHFGWNAGYRSDNRKILYSGDMTSADPYATEAFRIEVDEDETYMLNTSLYYGENDTPFKFMLTDVDISNKGKAPVNVEDALFAPIEMKFNGSDQLNIGFIKGNSFCFCGSELGKSITPDEKLNAKALEATVGRCLNMYKLRDFIKLCGGNVISSVDSLTDEEKANVISLEPNALTATTLFDIID